MSSQRLSQRDDDEEETTVAYNDSLWCGCGPIFIGIYFISVWTLFMSLVFIAVGSIGASGFSMSSSTLTNVKTYQILIGLLIIPGVLRIISAAYGFCLPSRLRQLAEVDHGFVRPDKYNKYELSINIWTWTVLWLPIVTNSMLTAAFIGYLVIIGEGQSYWNSTTNTATNFLSVMGLTFAIFTVPVTDIVLCYHFYTVFREFVETRFMNILGVCGCCSMWAYRKKLDLEIYGDGVPPTPLDTPDLDFLNPRTPDQDRR